MAGVVEQINRGSGQVSPAAALPTSSAEAFGAGIGDAVAGAGSEIHASAMRAMQADKKRQNEVAATEFGVNSAQAALSVDTGVKDLEQNAPPGAEGHVDRVADLFDKTYAPVVEGIKDPRLRSQAQVEIAERRARVVSDADTWFRGARTRYGGDNIKAAAELSANQLQDHPDEASYLEARKNLSTVIGAQGLSADATAAVLKETTGTVAVSYARGLIDQDPAAALVLLHAGHFDDALTPQSKATLVNEAETGVRVAVADARRVQSQAVSQLVQDVGEFKQTVSRGELPGEDVPKALITRAQQLGRSDLIDDVQHDFGTLKYSRITDKWTSADWEHNVNSLAAKVAQGKASGDEQQELKLLTELRPAKEARFKSDPDGFAAAGGMDPPQVDLANPDPGSVQARKSWARAFAHTGGLIEPPFLSKDQLQVYRDRAAQGPVGQLEVASDLRKTWGMDAAPSIVRQIGGEAKADMQIMLGLNDRMAQVYRGGREALSKKAVELNEDAARQVWGSYANAVPPDVRPALFDAARNIAAGWMNEQGKTKPTADFADVFGKALHRAAGMLGSWGEGSATGGFVNWNGRFAWLPQDMARNDFQGRISRAAPQDWLRAAVDAAGNPVAAVPHHLGSDGKLKPYTKGEAMHFGSGGLVTVAPGIFHLVDPAGGTVVDQNGRPWQFDVRRLPRGHFGK